MSNNDECQSFVYRDPHQSLKGGYDIHVYFQIEQHSLAVSIYENFLNYLNLYNIRPTFSFIYDKGPDYEGGPHKGPMWVVQLMGINPARDIIQQGGNDKAIYQLGIAVSWLMLNRQGLQVLIHPNIALPFGEVQLEKIDHIDHAVWLGGVHPIPNPLDIEFFDRLLEKDAKHAEQEAIERLKIVKN